MSSIQSIRLWMAVWLGKAAKKLTPSTAQPPGPPSKLRSTPVSARIKSFAKAAAEASSAPSRSPTIRIGLRAPSLAASISPGWIPRDAAQAENLSESRIDAKEVESREWNYQLFNGRTAVKRRKTLQDDKRKWKQVWWEVDGKRVSTLELQNQLPLYLGDRVRHDGSPLLVCEGETAVDALAEKYNLKDCVGTPNGALNTPTIRALLPLLGHPVVLWPDNDDSGRLHMHSIASRLTDMGHGDVRILEWKSKKPGADAADFEGDVKALEKLLASAAPWDRKGPALPDTFHSLASATHLRLQPQQTLAPRLAPSRADRIEFKALRSKLKDLEDQVAQDAKSKDENRRLNRLEHVLQAILKEGKGRLPDSPVDFGARSVPENGSKEGKK